MPILPVLDILHGQVVRGIAGRRHEYRPIVSGLCRSSVPGEVARAIADHYGFGEFYLADLNAIDGAPPAQAIYDSLHAAGYRLWIDAGVRTPADASRLAALGVCRVVVGLETVAGPDAVAAIGAALGPDRVVFSLDLKAGQPLGDLRPWQAATADGIAARAITAGITQLLVLDLAHVGSAAGTGTAALCTRLHRAYPAVSLAAGGGVRGMADVRRLYECGVRDVLVASALHAGDFTQSALDDEPAEV